jgi:creatinine amidohydrolase
VEQGEVRLWKLTRKEVREGLAAGRFRAAILPAGSTEQHNEHLALGHDTASATAVSCRAARTLYPRVVVATPLAVGLSEHWMDFPGTLTLKPETFFAVARDVCESLSRHGIRHILIVNGHAGNTPLSFEMGRFRDDLGVDVRFVNYWDGFTPALVRAHMVSGKMPAHAAEFETSFALAEFPETVRWEGVDYERAGLVIRRPPGYAEEDAAAHREARSLATAAKGRAMVDAAVSWTAAMLEEMIGTEGGLG